MSKRLKVAFLGGSHLSAVGRAHLTAIETDRRFELAAACFSRDPQANAAAAQAYLLDHSRLLPDLDALLAARDHFDALVLLTPTNQHFEQLMQCRAASVPVICEKAMVADLQQAQALKQLHVDGQHFLAVTYNYTGYPMVRELKSMIARGELGDILQVRAEMPQEGFIKVNAEGQPFVPQGWRLQDGPVPTVSLDLGVHVHALVKFLTGQKATRVTAHTASLGNFSHVADTVNCLALYNGGMQASMWFTKAALGHRNGLRIEVYGSKRSAVWVQEQPEMLHMGTQTGQRYTLDRASPECRIANQDRYTRFKAGHPAGFIEAFANYYSDIADALLAFQANGQFRETEYVLGPDTAIEGIEFLNAVATASQTATWVDL